MDFRAPRQAFPHLIDLYPRAGEVPKRLVLVIGASIARFDLEFYHGILRDIHHAGGGANRIPLYQCCDDLGLFGAIQTVHGIECNLLYEANTTIQNLKCQ